MMKPMSPRIADALVERGLLDRFHADAALREEARTGLELGQLVVDRRWVSDDVFAQVVAEVFGIERLALDRTVLDPALASGLGEHWVRSEGLMPLVKRADGRELLVASTNPDNVRGVDALAFRFGQRVRLLATGRHELEVLIRHAFHGDPLPRPAVDRSHDDRDALARAVGENRQAAEALRAIFELCVERGLFTREELDRRLAASDARADRS